ncbi:MAG: peptidoglycan DD-metalloendopeptidase family protein [Tessaracoccus sp.]|uniref:M23 family metallopeptidase n=1 Tax=Tessaracoccus sp. TaxID=1971211 RepID=UPI001EB8A060|nr:M23 family metallopeptidase [Tessaracoccus sp.]MBK7820414.1 peptidoglycan DD-metalloendopeptidase family protein [Tessaracoccus sp.]
MALKYARGIVAAALTVGLLGTWQPAHADKLDDKKDQLQQQIEKQESVVDAAVAEHDDAVAAAERAEADLEAAEQRLAAAEREREAAEKRDKKAAAELEAAEAKLAQAQADVAAAQAALDSTNRRLNEEILVTTQNTDGLMNLALLFHDVDTSNLNARAQLAETLFTSSAKQLDELEERRLALEAAEAVAAEAEAEATRLREAAAKQLKEREAAERWADAARDDVADLLAERQEMEQRAASVVSEAEKVQADLEADAADVERRIKDRIARENKRQAKLEADRKAAQEKADRAARQSKSKKSNKKSSSSSKSSRGSSSKSSSSSSSSGRFIYPAGGRITSQYGMRLHPVLGYWKLHDGTDFGAACGAPIKAAASGVVSDRYYNAGYGNRLMIDHGKVNGHYVTTGYNHASKYVVSVGQRVSQGQTIGYVGSTGYSTGCHLHLMVWDNGSLVNPMAKWFR